MYYATEFNCIPLEYCPTRISDRLKPMSGTSLTFERVALEPVLQKAIELVENGKSIEFACNMIKVKKLKVSDMTMEKLRVARRKFLKKTDEYLAKKEAIRLAKLEERRKKQREYAEKRKVKK